MRRSQCRRVSVRSRPSRSAARTGSICVRQAISSPVGRGPSGANRSSGVAETPGRPIDHLEPQVIDVGDLVHRLGDREPEDAVDRAELVVRDRDGFVAVGLAVDAGGDQIAEPAAAQEVADADEALAVPREKYRATARLAVVLDQVELLVGRQVELALQDTVRPAEMDEVDLRVLAQAQHDRRDRLAQAGVGRGVVVRDVESPALRGARGCRSRASWSASRASTCQWPSSCECQPVMAVAQVPGQRGGSPGRIDQESGSASPTRSTAIMPSRPGPRARGQSLRREPLPFVAGPGRHDGRPASSMGRGVPRRSGQPSRSRSIGLRRAPVDSR